MPLALAHAAHSPLGIYQVVNQKNESSTATYSAVRSDAIYRVYKSSAFWQDKAAFAEDRQRLEMLAFLREGWDGYGGEAPNASARKLASNILDILESSSFKPAQLSASVEGGVAISFANGQKRAIIEVYNTSEVAAATYSNDHEPTPWEPKTDSESLEATIDKIRVYLAT